MLLLLSLPSLNDEDDVLRQGVVRERLRRDVDRVGASRAHRHVGAAGPHALRHRPLLAQGPEDSGDGKRRWSGMYGLTLQPKYQG